MYNYYTYLKNQKEEEKKLKNEKNSIKKKANPRKKIRKIYKKL